MQAIISKLLGDNPKTSILGIIIAALGITHEALKSGETNWIIILLSVFTGILGLNASDATKKDNSTQNG